jgi:hypothetical protein
MLRQKLLTGIIPISRMFWFKQKAQMRKFSLLQRDFAAGAVSRAL